MTTNQMTYDALYQSMKKRFTVVRDNCEYTLGGYMRSKCGEKTATGNLPVAVVQATQNLTVVQNVFHYVEDKLEVKAAPAPEKTQTAFPIRTSFSALACGLIACSMIFSFAFIGSRKINSFSQVTMQNKVEIITEEDTLPANTVFEAQA